MKGFLFFLTIMAGMVCHAQKSDEKLIREMLAAQVNEWNRGNITGYMKGYREDDSLVFIGKNGPTYGFRATLERYQKAYPDPDAMGKLRSAILSVKKLSGEYFFVTGQWYLERDAGNLNGSYTLLLQKINGEWVIISDHSS